MIKVVKIGGNVVDNPQMLEQFSRDFAAMEGPRILVHGGGVKASRIQKELGQQPIKIEGRRVTDQDTLEIVTMVYAGWCSKNIVALLQKNGCNAIGLAGCDGNVITAVKRPPVAVSADAEIPEGVTVTEDGKIDFGYVGDVRGDSVNAGFLMSLVQQGICPVLCAINHDGNGTLLNTNADTIASSVATALAGCDEVELIYCFEKDGVLYDKDDDSSVIPHIDPAYYSELKAEGRVADGMIPKLDNSFKAISQGVSKVTIKHAANLLSTIGTQLTLQTDR